MFVVKSKAKNGGIWDAKNNCIVYELKTKDKSVAESCKACGCFVEEVKKSDTIDDK